MRSLLDNLAILKYYDTVEARNGRKAVSYYNGSATMHEAK